MMPATTGPWWMPTRTCQGGSSWPAAATMSCPALTQASNRTFDRTQQAGRGNERVAHSLEFLQSTVLGDILEAIDQAAQHLDDHFRRIALAIRGEADDVAEQDGDVGEASRPDIVGGLSSRTASSGRMARRNRSARRRSSSMRRVWRPHDRATACAQRSVDAGLRRQG